MLNINWGRNRELMDRCRKLREYAQFLATVRKKRLSDLTRLLAAQNRMDDIVRAAEDPEYQQKLFEEFGI